MANTAWNEEEIRAAVLAYFELFEAQERGEKINKKEIYRKLSLKHSARSEKSFELKFQNISAILFEEHLPFCDGLKPKPNYQYLLRLFVLDYLHRNPQPVRSPKQILLDKLETIHRKGAFPVKGKGSGRYGLALESQLGIPPNSNKSADFMGIELKAKTDKSLQTLFSRTPSKYVSCAGKAELLEIHGYWDAKRSRKALYTSFNSTGDSLGFSLRAAGNIVLVKREEDTLIEYQAERIEEALLSKHSQTAFIFLEPARVQGNSLCKIQSAKFCKWPSIIRFLELINHGQIYLDLTLSESNGAVKDHGFLWRIRSEALPTLYLHTESIDFALQV